jgi:hypothetical protein
MHFTIGRILYYLTIVSVTIFGAVNYKKLTTPFKLLTILLALTIVSEIANRVCAKVYHNSLPVYNLVAINESIFYSLIYYNIFKGSVIKNILVLIAIIVPVFAVVNAFTLQPFMSVFPSNVLFITTLLYVIFAMLLYREMLFNTLETSLFKQSIFWYNTAVLFFSVTMFLSFCTLNYIIKHHLRIGALDYLDDGANLIFYFALGYAIYLNTKEKKLMNG